MLLIFVDLLLDFLFGFLNDFGLLRLINLFHLFLLLNFLFKFLFSSFVASIDYIVCISICVYTLQLNALGRVEHGGHKTN